MKKFGLLSSVLIAALTIALAAQAPPAGGQGGAGGRGPGGGAGAPGGGAPGGGGGRGGAPGGGGRGAAAPAAPAALQTFADNLAAAINKQDAAALTKMLAMDALYLDEDGHAIPAPVWVMRLTTGTPPKVFAINSSHGQMLDDNTAWVSFNYTLGETFQQAPKTLSGTASLVLKKAAGGDWTIMMVHGALKQNVAGVTQ
jgi:ketosteroid isomerase-like protein